MIKTAIIIPVYNRAERFEYLLNSLVAQYNFSDFYTVVIDDCSEEDIHEVCLRFDEKLHIQYFRTETNIGPGPARNIGLDWCEENEIEYVMFCDADDIVLPGGVKQLANYLDVVKDSDIVSAPYINVFNHCILSQTDSPKDLVWVFSKMYRLKSLNGLRFLDIPCLEDLCFNMCLFTNKYIHLDTAKTPIYCHCADDQKSLTNNLKHQHNYLYSQSYNNLLAIVKMLEYTNTLPREQINVANALSINQIISIYTTYETGITIFPDHKDKFDILINEIFANQYIKDIYNSPEIYLDILKQTNECLYTLTNENDEWCNDIEVKKIHFFEESFKEFLDNHNINVHVQFDRLYKNPAIFYNN